MATSSWNKRKEISTPFCINDSLEQPSACLYTVVEVLQASESFKLKLLLKGAGAMLASQPCVFPALWWHHWCMVGWSAGLRQLATWQKSRSIFSSVICCLIWLCEPCLPGLKRREEEEGWTFVLGCSPYLDELQPRVQPAHGVFWSLLH